MKMLSSSAQTLPLYVGKLGEKPPPLCGAIPADPNYIAKVSISFTSLSIEDSMMFCIELKLSSSPKMNSKI